MLIKEEYKKSWNHIKESKKFIYIAGIIFFIAFISGFLQLFFQEQTHSLLNEIEDEYKLDEYKGFNEYVLDIFFHNLKIDFNNLFLGFIYGIIPFNSGITGGYIIGFAMSKYFILNIFYLLIILLLAILEFSTLFISMGLGFKSATFILKKEKLKSLKHYMINNLRIGILIIMPIVLISAFIEVVLIRLL